MSHRFMFLGLLFGLVLLAQISAAVEVAYQGRPLRVSSDTGPLTWTCRATHAAGTGYYRGPQGWTLSSEYTKQSRPATWIITFQGNAVAQVTDGQGNVGRDTATKHDATGVTWSRRSRGPVSK
jgi:hypothetical protein